MIGLYRLDLHKFFRRVRHQRGRARFDLVTDDKESLLTVAAWLEVTRYGRTTASKSVACRGFASSSSAGNFTVEFRRRRVSTASVKGLDFDSVVRAS